MLGTHPVSHTGGHQLGPFHDCTSHRQHCHSERSRLYPEEVVDCHASGTLLEIESHVNIINCPVTFNLEPLKFAPPGTNFLDPNLCMSMVMK